MDGDGKPLNGGLKQHGNSGVYRITRNLALSRAIGDRSELPFSLAQRLLLKRLNWTRKKTNLSLLGVTVYGMFCRARKL